MKGTLFVQLMGHLEETYGYEKVDEILEKVGDSLSTGGAYTSVGNYPHTELLMLAAEICKTSGTPLESLIRDFAGYLMKEFYRMHSEYFDNFDNIFEFMGSLESLIHTDVRKLYPDARPPLVLTEMRDDGSMLVSYESTRPLALVALELTRAAGEHFGQPLELNVVEQSEDQCSLTFTMRKRHD